MKEVWCDKDSVWTSVNWIDANNRFVGFDAFHNCCEFFGWYVSESPDEPESLDEPDRHDIGDGMDPYCFDPDGFREAACSIIARLTAPGMPDKYLHVFNHHNGYYAHGFEFGVKGGNVTKGAL